MAKISGLGHVGLYVHDMPAMLEFYTEVLGLTVTDCDHDAGVSYLSPRPKEKHTELAFIQSDDQETQAGQVSFHVASLDDLKTLYRKVRDRGCTFDRIVNHGIALGAYFRDLENNRVEIYWSTGIDYPQPFAIHIDLDAPDEELLQQLDELPPREGTGPHLYGRDVGKRIRADVATEA
ncbi:VOC family protein [Nocardia miyunensis]|uniref:VOC family protein n=1 Tax=Nocardia miyunensis TaxID=282684 RepID=UPI0008311DCA|nr:VOC family protein [Nocardia miyunensis]